MNANTMERLYRQFNTAATNNHYTKIGSEKRQA
jgi:hypothetical protein